MLTSYACILVVALAWKKHAFVHTAGLFLMFLGVALFGHNYDLSTMAPRMIAGYVWGFVFLRMQFSIFFDFIEAVFEESVIKLET